LIEEKMLNTRLRRRRAQSTVESCQGYALTAGGLKVNRVVGSQAEGTCDCQDLPESDDRRARLNRFSQQLLDQARRAGNLVGGEITASLADSQNIRHLESPERRYITGKHRLAWYDSIIIASALESQCETLYSEDSQHGREIEGLRIENPLA
jgi:hypothetical protein